MQKSKILAVKKALEAQQTDLVVFTDIDGTFYKWQLLIQLVDWIAQSFPEKSAVVGPLRQAILDYRNQARDAEDYAMHLGGYQRQDYLFPVVMERLIKCIPEVFAGIPKKRVKTIAQIHTDGTYNQVYAFPKILYRVVKSSSGPKKRVLVAITGAPNEVAEPLCAKYDFDVVIGSYYKTDRDGIYTGKRDIDSGINKGKILDALGAVCDINWSSAIAIGDSETDIPMFERCGYAFAVNPNETLIEYIRKSPKRIRMVRCGQKSRTQIFAPSKQGLFIERCPDCSFPPDIGPRFPVMRGMSDRSACICKTSIKI
ncbi:MAG: HAD family hydrolase [Patescibacteria group bacterium]